MTARQPAKKIQLRDDLLKLVPPHLESVEEAVALEVAANQGKRLAELAGNAGVSLIEYIVTHSAFDIYFTKYAHRLDYENQSPFTGEPVIYVPRTRSRQTQKEALLGYLKRAIDNDIWTQLYDSWGSEEYEVEMRRGRAQYAFIKAAIDHEQSLTKAR
jgi:hypothetical protein